MYFPNLIQKQFRLCEVLFVDNSLIYTNINDFVKQAK